MEWQILFRTLLNFSFIIFIPCLLGKKPHGSLPWGHGWCGHPPKDPWSGTASELRRKLDIWNPDTNAIRLTTGTSSSNPLICPILSMVFLFAGAPVEGLMMPRRHHWPLHGRWGCVPGPAMLHIPSSAPPNCKLFSGPWPCGGRTGSKTSPDSPGEWSLKPQNAVVCGWTSSPFSSDIP